MSNSKSKKVCIVVISLANGGAERSSALLSKMLYNSGFEVHIVSILDEIEYDYNGKLYNLGKLKSKNHSTSNRFKRFLLWKSYMKTHKFDYVIDNRTRIGFFKELIISKYIYKSTKPIYCVRSYNILRYINPNKILSRILYKNAFKIIGVSREITNTIVDSFSLNNVVTIYNPFEYFEVRKLIKKNDFSNILYFGRLDDKIKNISLLLEAYVISQLPKKNIKLIILGRGEDRALLEEKVKHLSLNNHVLFEDFTTNPSTYIEQALFTVLTSRYEGFPRSILESLSCGTPVVSVDCKSGPNEIIKNRKNGLLVENHNPNALAEAFNTLISDKALYSNCKQNSKSSIAHLSMENIAKSWEKILK